MTGEPSVPFRIQLQNICEMVEQTKIHRERRHSDFVRRFNDLVSRHARLTSGRLRRLSLDGIVLDLESLGIRPLTDRNPQFWDTEITQQSPRNRTPIDRPSPMSRNETNNSSYLPQITDMNVKKTLNENDATDKPAVEKRSQANPRVTFKLELSFHCNTPSPPITNVRPTRPKAKSPVVFAKRKPSVVSIESDATHTSRQAHRKLQRAYTRIVSMKKMTFMRRQSTVLSLVPKDVCKDLELPNSPPYRREWSGNGFGSPQNIEGQRLKLGGPPQLRLAFGRKRPDAETTKAKLHRTIQRMRTWKGFQDR